MLKVSAQRKKFEFVLVKAVLEIELYIKSRKNKQ